MRSLIGTALSLCLALVSARAARADDIVLANGDVLRGRLERQGDGWVLHHAVLGAISLKPDAIQSHQPVLAAPSDLLRLTTHTPPPAPARVERTGIATDAWLTSDCGCEPKDPAACPWSGHAGLALSLAEGNTEKFDIFADVHVAYERGPSKVLGELDYKYGESRGERTADHWHGKLRYDHAINALSYAFVQTLFERDEVAEQDYRIHGLVGYGRKLYRTKVSELKAELGGGVVWERYSGRKETADPSAYLGLDYCHKWADGSALNAGIDYLPNLNNYDLTAVIFDARYTKPLSGKLDLVVGLRIEHTIDPPGAVEDTDLFLNVGIRVKF